MAEERDLKAPEIIYLDLSSQYKPTYGGYKNWILVQDLNTKQKWYFFMNSKEYLTEKATTV